MRWSRREWLLAMGALTGCSFRPAAGGCASLAGATIRWIVPFGDGGSFEVFSRLLEPFFEAALGAEVVIVMEPGNGGIVGATKLRDATPDGRTVGILNAPGLFGAALAGDDTSPNPARDFAVLGRMGRGLQVLAVAASSGLETMEDLIERQTTRPLVCGFSGLASNGLLSVSVCEVLLGLRVDYIAGFSGSRDGLLAVLRGDTDLLSANLESLQPSIDEGDLRVLLEIADGPVSEDLSVAPAAWLGGPNGWAARRATELGRDMDSATSDAAALIELSGAGIIVAAPKTLPGDLLACLRARFHEAASSAGFQTAARAARRTPDVATGEAAEAELSAAESHVTRFAPVVREAFRRARK